MWIGKYASWSSVWHSEFVRRCVIRNAITDFFVSHSYFNAKGQSRNCSGGAALFLGLQNYIFSPFPLHRRAITDSSIFFLFSKVTMENRIHKEFTGFWTSFIVRCLKENDVSEAGSISETSCSFNHRTMDNVQKPRNSLCYTPSSQPFTN
jgi:hypothetical protein